MKKNLRLCVIGMNGRMGRELQSLAPHMGFQITCGVDRTRPLSAIEPRVCDAVIDFSLPSATAAVSAWCVKNRRPLVSGVTGLRSAEMKSLQKAGKKVAVFWAPNMSLGVAVLAQMLAHLRALDDFDFQIEEIHHRAKKDRPSGTALFLQERLSAAVGKRKTAKPISIRGGGVYGTHRVLSLGDDEVILLEHQALNRRVFARGALQATRWICGQKPGLYSMKDLLGPLHL